ncbi:MAG: glycerophosphodiester phosphodiesterase [Acidimicrobiales bacterium]|nr:glycerophosphodiester phosphodiesterase [Acidimicrobiales bacterium]
MTTSDQPVPPFTSSTARPPRYRSLRTPPIAFAHRGAKAHAPENTIEAFRLALRLGATGLESDVFMTGDGVPVLDHDGVVGSVLRKRSICDIKRRDLPDHIPTLTELYDAVGSDFELSLDIKDPAALDAVVEVSRQVDAEERLWLCHPALDVLSSWRQKTSAQLVNSVRVTKISEGLELRAAKLADIGIDAINMRYPDWNAGHVSVVHRFELYALGWDAQQHREIAALYDMGLDGVFSDHVDRLSETLALFY